MLKGRAQCIVLRDNKLLVAKHYEQGHEYYAVPGGGIEEGETPEEAAIRELKEEACVDGTIIKKLGEYVDPFNENKMLYNFLVDIGEQTPQLGYDPECLENPILVGIEWKAFDELPEKDRAYFLAAGLLSIREFVEELDSWGDEISYPVKK